MGMMGLFGDGGGGVTPADIAGCTLWLRADLGVTKTGTAVTAWANQGSVGGTFAGTATYVAEAINGKDGFLFNGTSDELVLANTAFSSFQDTAAMTLAVVSKKNVTSAGAILTTTSGVFAYYAPYTSGYGWLIDCWGAGEDRVLVAHSITDWTYSRAVRSDALLELFNNDVSLGSKTNCANNRPAGNTTWTIGHGDYFADASIAEIVMYNKALSSGEIGVLKTYITVRYGI